MQNYFHQPDIDPVLFRLWGPFQIRWYSLLYVGGFLVGRAILKKLSKEERFKFTADDMEQLILWLLVGAVVGARIIYCFVYDPWALAANPLYLFEVYRGGLSFHGGVIGMAVAAYIFSQQRKIPFWNLSDAMCLAGPSGLAMGRLGNFINGELYGRVTDVPWAVVFRDGGPAPRHPSQLYEGFLEGIVLLAILWFLKKRVHRDGILSMVFFFGYTLCRFFAEFFREPDAQLGYLAFGLSMGQILSIVMLFATMGIAWWLHTHPPATVPTRNIPKKNNKIKKK